MDLDRVGNDLIGSQQGQTQGNLTGPALGKEQASATAQGGD